MGRTTRQRWGWEEAEALKWIQVGPPSGSSVRPAVRPDLRAPQVGGSGADPVALV